MAKWPNVVKDKDRVQAIRTMAQLIDWIASGEEVRFFGFSKPDGCYRFEVQVTVPDELKENQNAKV